MLVVMMMVSIVIAVTRHQLASDVVEEEILEAGPAGVPAVTFPEHPGADQLCYGQRRITGRVPNAQFPDLGTAQGRPVVRRTQRRPQTQPGIEPATARLEPPTLVDAVDVVGTVAAHEGQPVGPVEQHGHRSPAPRPAPPGVVGVGGVEDVGAVDEVSPQGGEAVGTLDASSLGGVAALVRRGRKSGCEEGNERQDPNPEHLQEDDDLRRTRESHGIA